jgi:phosphatidate cytidylyltransferase
MGGDLQAESGARQGNGRTLDHQRVYVALIFLPLFYLLVRYAPPVGFFLLVLGASLVALAEFYFLYFREERPVGAILLGLAAATLWLTALQWPAFLSERALLVMILAGLLAYQVAAVIMGVSRGVHRSITDSAVLLFGVAYVGLTLGHLLLTRALPEGEFLIFFVVLVTWAGDTGAYYVGVRLGRRPLAPAISPRKTVEGLLGGVALAVVAALSARAWFLPGFSIADSVTLGLLLTAAGVLGDLSESVLKRGAGVKDSGTIIPAHGGMLDRLDSLLFAAPAFYYYMVLFRGE